MIILFRLSLLFWTPLLIVLLLNYQLAKLFGWILFEKGRMTPFFFNLYRTFSLNTYFGFQNFYLYLISSLDLKGDLTMGKIFGLRPDQTQEFEPKGQDNVPSDEKLIFLCKFLDVNLSALITDQVYTAKGFGAKREELLRAGTQEMEILRRGLVGWKNFFYEDGSEIEWEDVPRNVSKQKANTVMDKNLNKIPPDTRGDVADFIRGSSTADSD